MAKLVGIFSGKTKIYSEKGVHFQTAIVKKKVTGKVDVDFSGLVGNDTANHKNALYAVSVESYQYWREHSALPVQWQQGLFGENFCVSGIDEHSLFIGDYLYVGDLVLQVSGCRTPCGNLLWRLNAPSSFLGQFQKSGHSGFYLEVIKGGQVEAGDKIRHVCTPQSSITVAKLAEIFMSSNPDLQLVKRLIKIDGMGLQMQDMLTALLNTQVERALVFKNRWQGWKRFEICKIVSESKQVKSFYLQAAIGHEFNKRNSVGGYRAGQYLTVKIKSTHGVELTRCWSLSDYDEALTLYRISVKREPQGRASQVIHDTYQEGDVLDVLAPLGNFALKRNHVAIPVILISAGIGITPMISMLKSHQQRLDKRLPTLHFIHSTQNADTHTFKDEISTIIDRNENFHQHIFYSRGDNDNKPSEAYIKNARLDFKALQDILLGIGCWFSKQWIDVTPADCHYYICGPSGFISDMQNNLVKLGVGASSIFFESFTNELLVKTNKAQQPATVRFSVNHKKAQWQPEKPLTLLELAEQNGLTPAYACRNGQCGLCQSKKLSGIVDYILQPTIDIAADNILLCCTIPNGDVELDM